MQLDFRVDTRLPRHRKYKKLKRILGISPMEYLITFWGTVAEQVPNGALNGWSNDDIESAAEWDGKQGFLCSAMIESGFLDTKSDGFYPHDWHDHQPWVIGAKERSEAARKAGIASASARRALFGTAQPTVSSPNTRSNTRPNAPERLPNPRTPSPSPSPLKDTSSNYTTKFEEFWEKYPRKKGKAKAFSFWKKHKCENGIYETILTSLEKHIDSKDWAKDGGLYIPYGSTWVSGRSWEDTPDQGDAAEWR